jgi:hypothetical protein
VWDPSRGGVGSVGPEHPANPGSKVESKERLSRRRLGRSLFRTRGSSERVSAVESRSRRSAPAGTGEGPMASTFELEHPDGTPADPPTIRSAVPNWQIPRGQQQACVPGGRTQGGERTRAERSSRRRGRGAGEQWGKPGAKLPRAPGFRASDPCVKGHLAPAPRRRPTMGRLAVRRDFGSELHGEGASLRFLRVGMFVLLVAAWANGGSEATPPRCSPPDNR